MMNIATKRFAPLIGILTLLVIVALAGSALSSSKRPPTIGPAATTIELPEAAPNPTTTAPPTTTAQPEPAPTPVETPQQQVPQTPQQQVPVPQQQVPIPQPATPEVVVPQQPLVYDDYGDDIGELDFDD